MGIAGDIAHAVYTDVKLTTGNRMNCFNHKEMPAIGTCKCCCKGLCAECAVDLGHGLACKGVHEQQVDDIQMVVNKSVKIYSSANKNTLIAPIFYLFMGLVFFVYGLTAKANMVNLLTVMGAGFIIFAVVVFIRNWQVFSSRQNA